MLNLLLKMQPGAFNQMPSPNNTSQTIDNLEDDDTFGHFAQSSNEQRLSVRAAPEPEHLGLYVPDQAQEDPVIQIKKSKTT